MRSAGRDASEFADVLRDAILDRGLGLERIQQRLAERGVHVSVATLSYWRSGRSLPARRQSLAALPHLEALLGLAPGVLTAALGSPYPRGRPRRAVPSLASVWQGEPAADVLAELDGRWDAELDRISCHDMLRIGADRAEHSMRVRQVLRARSDGPDRCLVMHMATDTDAAPGSVRCRRGCHLGLTSSDPARGVVAVELMFAAPLHRGESVVIEHEIVSARPGPRESFYERRRRLPMREYVLDVGFDPAEPPAACESYDAITGRRLAALDLDPWHSVHVVALDCAAGGGLGVRWTWPTPQDGHSE